MGPQGRRSQTTPVQRQRSAERVASNRRPANALAESRPAAPSAISTLAKKAGEEPKTKRNNQDEQYREEHQKESEVEKEKQVEEREEPSQRKEEKAAVVEEE